MILRRGLLAVMGIMLAVGMGASAAFAQEPQSQTAPSADGTLQKDRIERREQMRQRMGEREGLRGQREMGRRGGMGRMLRELNLTETQRQQSRAIMQRRLESTKLQREELFKLREKRIAGTFTADDEARAKALHQEIRKSMEGVREEMAGVLTEEQKAKLQELKAQRKERIEQRMKERQERLNQKPM